jgi:hypothetical protein
MEKTARIIVADEKEIEFIIEKAVKRAISKPSFENVDFEKEKLTKVKAAELAGISIPTLNKLIKNGKFKEHNLGQKKYLLKSEMLTVLRNSNI